MVGLYAKIARKACLNPRVSVSAEPGKWAIILQPTSDLTEVVEHVLEEAGFKVCTGDEGVIVFPGRTHA